MSQFLIANGPMPTTAAFAGVATGTVIKTMLQVKPSATLVARVKEWGYFLDQFTPAANGAVELIETDVAATVTAAVAADITKFDAAALMGGDPTTNLIQVGTTSTGYTASGEGSITAVRLLDCPQYADPTGKFSKQFPLGCEPIIQINKFLRIRVTFAVSYSMRCYVIVEI